MKRFSKILLLCLVLVVAVSCSVTSAETGDIKEVKVPVPTVSAPPAPVQEEPVAPSPVAEVAEPAPEEIAIVEETAKIWEKQIGKGYLIIAAYDGIAYVMVPEGVTDEDLNAFIGVIAEDFGSVLDGVVITGSDIADYEIRGLSKESAMVGMQILDLYFDHYVALASGEEDIQNTRISFGEDGALIYTMYANDQEVNCTFYQGYAYVSFPEDVTLENLLLVRDALLATYNDYLEGTTVDYIEDGLLVVTYPASVDYSEIVTFISASKSDVPVLSVILPHEEAVSVIEVATAPAETTTVKEVAEKVVETIKETAATAVETVKETTQKVVEAASSIELPQQVEAKRSSALSVILIIIIVLLVAACAYYFLVYRRKK